MFMQRIEIPVEIAARANPPSLVRFAVIVVAGMSFIAIMVPLTICYWVMLLIWFGVHAAAKVSATVARTVFDTINFAGTAIVGHH